MLFGQLIILNIRNYDCANCNLQCSLNYIFYITGTRHSLSILGKAFLSHMEINRVSRPKEASGLGKPGIGGVRVGTYEKLYRKFSSQNNSLRNRSTLAAQPGGGEQSACDVAVRSRG